MNDDWIQIRDFTEADLDRAGEIALQIWGSESELIPPSMGENLYAYLARYYYVADSPFSCVAERDGKICAFLLAAENCHDSSAADSWIEPRLSSASEKKLLQSYKAYLDGNKEAEYRLVQEREVVLHLFASIQKGCGSMLMQEFLHRCRKQGIESLILWTDDTCDFEWYRRNHFTELTHFTASPCLPGRTLTTFIFRKKVSR